MKLIELENKIRSMRLEHGKNCEVGFDKIMIVLPDGKLFELTKDTEVVRTQGLREDYYEGCYHNIDDKTWTLGEQMTLRELLDCWWNSVRIAGNSCYKNAYYEDSEYELGDLDESDLDRVVEVDDDYDYDADGYPIVYARFVEEEDAEEEDD